MQVFLVIRPSKDRKNNMISPQDRLKQLLKGPEFALLHSQMESVLSRITVISADLSMPSLGLQQDDFLKLKA
jgi:thioester reductase-like protein